MKASRNQNDGLTGFCCRFLVKEKRMPTAYEQIEQLASMFDATQELTLYLDEEPAHRGNIASIRAYFTMRQDWQDKKISVREDWDLSEAPPGLFVK